MNTSGRLTKIALALALSVALSACGLTAPKRNAGYADLDGLSWRDVDTTMTLSIGPTLLQLAANMIDDDPATQNLLRGLQGVRVRTYLIEGNALRVASDLDEMGMGLREQGWEPMIRIMEEESTTHLLVKTECEEITGLTVLTSDGEEVVVVNVMGQLRPELFSEAMQALQVPQADVELPDLPTADT